jgi:quinohemoprotein ethanol dehydrogenase
MSIVALAERHPVISTLSIILGGVSLLASCAPKATPGTASMAEAGRDINWESYGGDRNANHFSPLDQINTSNITRLGLVWSYDIDVGPNAYTAPIAVDGIMYFAAGYSVVHALDARTGKELWRYDPEAWKVAGQKMRASWGSRGIAYAAGKVLVATVDGRLIALSAKTGKPVWSVQTLDQDGAYITGPPWVAGDMVLIGFGGGDVAPVRGSVSAYDLATGHKAWRFYTVPGDPKKGPDGEVSDSVMAKAAATWTGEWWRYGGGGTVWHAMAYDRELNLVYIGTGNGAPWNRKIRSPGGGDNLFVCAILALRADTGEYAWHYQANPGETWDFNSNMDLELANLPIGGRTRKVLLHAPKNGFFYVIDRTNGKLISAEPFAQVNWADRIDVSTGRPVERPEARFPDGKPALVYPMASGAHGVEAMAFNPALGLAYIPKLEQQRYYGDPKMDLTTWRHAGGMAISPGVDLSTPPSKTLPPPAMALVAWDPIAQKAAWSVPLKGARNGGVLATAGGLVFEGQSTGDVTAYEGKTGAKLWSFYAQNGVMAQPISYSVGGRQYITVIASWRTNAPSGHTPEWDYHSQKRRVLTFALDGKKQLPPEENTPLPIEKDPDSHVDAALATKGQGLFGLRCAFCHGFGGASGGMAPNLKRSSIPLDAGAFRTVVREGALKPGGMPSFEELSDGELDALRHYLRQQRDPS